MATFKDDGYSAFKEITWRAVTTDEPPR